MPEGKKYAIFFVINNVAYTPTTAVPQGIETVENNKTVRLYDQWTAFDMLLYLYMSVSGRELCNRWYQICYNLVGGGCPHEGRPDVLTEVV